MIDILDHILRQSRRTVSSAHPSLERILTIPIYYYALAWITAARGIGAVQYEAPIDPMQIYYVDPQRIDRTVTWTHISADMKADEHPRFRPPKYRLAGRVFDGDWDTVNAQVSESTIYQSFVSHFENDVPWEETDFYHETLAVINDGEVPWGCASRSDLHERCRYLDELYERIATEGYKTQNELYKAGSSTTSPYSHYRVIWGEIAVNVGRDGEFIFQDGRNRLAIARILGLEAVPVVILVRHAKWQQTRDRIVRGDLNASDVSEQLRTHPDLVNLF